MDTSPLADKKVINKKNVLCRTYRTRNRLAMTISTTGALITAAISKSSQSLVFMVNHQVIWGGRETILNRVGSKKAHQADLEGGRGSSVHGTC